jgi:hypothetical protein
MNPIRVVCFVIVCCCALASVFPKSNAVSAFETCGSDTQACDRHAHNSEIYCSSLCAPGDQACNDNCSTNYIGDITNCEECAYECTRDGIENTQGCFNTDDCDISTGEGCSF